MTGRPVALRDDDMVRTDYFGQSPVTLLAVLRCTRRVTAAVPLHHAERREVTER